MSNENENGGNGQPTEEQLNALRAQMFQQAVAECASQLSGFFPQATDQALIEASAKALDTQSGPGMAQFLADAVKAETLLPLPGWGLRVKRKGSTDAAQVGTILVPVDTADVHSMDSVNQWVSVLAIATSPLARAALDLYGLEIQFIRSKTVPSLVKLQG